jgi:pimeloyl-ACP methyl ester carboxylesterase
MPEVFTALCMRATNFAGENFPLDMKKWKNRPIYLFWGDNDQTKAGQRGGPSGLKYLEDEVKAKNLKYKIIPGGGHHSRADLAASWFLSLIQNN